LRKLKLARKLARNYLHIMAQGRDVFQAISDPTRRQILSMLSHKSLNVNAIAEHFDMTRQAVSLHVQFLNECGLVVVKQQGRERFCEAQLDNLKEVTDWVAESKKIWLQKFSSLEKFLDKVQTQEKLKKAKNGKRK
jgi:DNA-binding transcriptional ArsR family regulator